MYYPRVSAIGTATKVLCLVACLLATAQIANSQVPSLNDIRVGVFKGQPIDEFLSAGGFAAVDGPADPNNPQPGYHDNGRGGNSFANDPCLDPQAPDRRRTVQSETEIAVLNTAGSTGKKIVVAYNDSFGFYDNTQGLSGFAYSVDGGNTFIDGGGLPPAVRGGVCASNLGSTAGHDCYFGDPVVVVHHSTQRFFYSSIYKLPNDTFSISVNRGTFQDAPPQGVESVSNTRCFNDATQFGIPDPPLQIKERIIWETPVVILQPTTTTANDFLDKEWMFVDQNSGTLYVTYTRFTPDGQTPLELMRCLNCANKATFTTADWDGPYTIVPNELDTFNQATMPVTTPSKRVVVTWFSRRFSLGGLGSEDRQTIQEAFSDTDGTAFTGRQDVAVVNPQGEPPGYNRGRRSILNAPYINVDVSTGSGNLYITYFSGKTPVASPPFARAADVFMSRSTTNAASWDPPVKMNDDAGDTSHVFPTVQVNKNGIVYADWLDRRNDPANVLTDAWANVSKDNGVTFGPDRLQTDVATSWFVRADARPNFGDYNSSDLLGFNDFVITFADGRFPPPAPAAQAATPDTIFTIANGLGVGSLSK